MTKGRRFHSLRTKFTIVLLLALALGLAGGGLTKLVGDSAIEYSYMSEAATEERCRKIIQNFTRFVKERNIDVQNAREITRWAKNQNHVYLMVSDGERVIVDSGWWDETDYYSAFGETVVDGDGLEEDFDAAELQPSISEDAAQMEEDWSQGEAGLEESYGYGVGSAPVEFSDGTYLVSVYDFSEEPLYEAVTIASYTVIIAVFLGTVLIYHQATIRQIIKLSHEVEEIAHGSLEGPITVKTKDEMGVLAQHVDTMRYSIIKEMRAEQEAWNANSDLITRMSHDIRTPLTVLLGFLELLGEGDYSQDENYQYYLAICKKNAFQLKELADKLFQYFLVFGHKTCELELEVTDAQVLLEQLVGEHVVLLQEQGWQIEHHPLERHGLIEVDTVYMKRLFDNLFSNIEKYADKEQPVEIAQRIEGEQLYVVLSNRVRPDPNPVESTNIGLKTCERIVQQMGGRFQFCKTEERFEADFTLPLYREPEELPFVQKK